MLKFQVFKFQVLKRLAFKHKALKVAMLSWQVILSMVYFVIACTNMKGFNMRYKLPRKVTPTIALMPLVP